MTYTYTEFANGAVLAISFYTASGPFVQEGRKGGREEGRKGGREEGRKGGRERGTGDSPTKILPFLYPCW